MQLHQKPRSEASKSDEWETPKELLTGFNKEYDLNLKLDVACTMSNCKCEFGILDAFTKEWVIQPDKAIVDIFCNPPNSLTQKYIERVQQHWEKYNSNCLMLIPINSTVTKNGKKYIWDNPDVEIHPVLPTPKFINPMFSGKLESARNRYCVVLWRKKK